ncbi:nucleoside deaminase [Geitlerinema sp. P-1104]|uniref:tRNA adenosine(34) deaminase TadA n=1 Tax=Geitlerinema sp. P-1104 TaxID=2546230 RepID=UPI0014770CAB|nr:tRNA adenosine(34) deaminase TadA [Geitlerinema sp. P-1104]NMG57285.1 nucleoside deaminase [Geitlerinema sp. P-1104]
MSLKELQQHRQWMQYALTLAQDAGEQGEIPVGALIVDGNNRLIASASNRKERDRDPTAHAEVLALRNAGRILNRWHLQGCRLYVTLEPCPMCAGAIVQSRISQLIYGADDPKTGAIRTVVNLPNSAVSNHSPQVVGGILEQACRQQLQTWFAQRRQPNPTPQTAQ